MLRLALLPLILATPPPLIAQTTWYVDASSPSPGDGTASSPYSRIDYAIAQPNVFTGDTVEVAAGDYFFESIDFLGKAVRLVGTAGPSETRVLGAGPQGADTSPLMVLQSAEGIGTEIRGLQFTQFRSTLTTPTELLVISNASPLFENCWFTNCHTDSALIAISNGSPTFAHCRWENLDFDTGVLGHTTVGGISATDSLMTFRDSSWLSCESPFKIVGGSSLFERCAFSLNRGYSLGNSSQAMFYANSALVQISDSSFQGNLVLLGANHPQLALRDCTAVIQACVFHGVGEPYSEVHSGGAIDSSGGSLSCENTSFSSCRSSSRAGAIHLNSTISTIDNCVFTACNAETDEREGGAIFAKGPSSLIISDCMFQSNRAGLGGAIGCEETPLAVRNSTFIGNIARKNTYKDPLRARGGAIWATGSTEIQNCLFENNFASASFQISSFDKAWGGAIYLEAQSVVSGSQFSGNYVTAGNGSDGGAIYAVSGAEVDRCLFINNSAQDFPGALGGALGGSGIAKRCTFDGNTSAGTASHADAWLIENCIAASSDLNAFGPMSIINHSLIAGGWQGVGNIDLDPKFWGNSDYHLMPGSFAVDAGNPLAPPDLDGSIADMGALPYDPQYCGIGCSTDIAWLTGLSNTNSTGRASLPFILGSKSVTTNNLVLAAEQLPTGTVGYFLLSTNPGFVHLFGGSQGNLCLGAPIVRWNDQIEVSNQAGRVSRKLDLTNPPGSLPIQPGDSWYFQLWYRDFVNGVSTSNTSHAMRILFE